MRAMEMNWQFAFLKVSFLKEDEEGAAKRTHSLS